MFEFLTQDSSVFSSSPEETFAIGKKLAAHLMPGTIVCLDGDLGAGKTTLIKGLIHALTHIEPDTIQSPTFIFLNIYPSATCSMCHFDLYRMTRAEEFQERGFLDYLDSQHICLIEWPAKITSLIPKEALLINIAHVNDSHRMLTFGTWGKRCP